MASRVVWRLRTLDWFLSFPLVVPLILLAAGNDSFGFDSPGRLDSFLYVGYFWHYPEHLPVFDEYYKISRLSWVIPGYLANRLGPIAGSYVLMYATLASGAAAVYLIIRDATGDRTVAAVTGVAWAGCTAGHGVGGWNYHIAGAASWYLIGVWLLLRAARHNSWPGGGAAGACLAAAIHAHLFLLVFTPFLLLVHIGALRAHGVRSGVQAVRGVVSAVVGGLLLTAALAAVNATTGGEWLFFMPQIRYTIWLGQPGNNSAWLPASQWLPSAKYLVLPVLFLLAGIVASVRRSVLHQPLRLALMAHACGAFALVSVFQFFRHQTVLDHDYQAFILYIPAFLCTGALVLGGSSNAVKPRSDAIVAGISTALIAGVLLFLMPSLPQRLSAISTFAPLGSALAPLILGLAGVAVTLLSSGTIRVLTFATWFSIVNAWVAPDARSYGIGSQAVNRQMLELFMDADRFTTGLDPSLRGIKYWLSSEEVETPTGRLRLSAVFDSFVATRGWLGNLLGLKSPGASIEQLTVENLNEGRCIAVLTSIAGHEAFLRDIEHRFAALDQPLTRLAARRFERPLVSFALTVYRPTKAPPQADQRPACLP